MDAGECPLASPGQDERSAWPLDLNLPPCPTTTKDTPLLTPNPSPEFSSSSSTSVTGGGHGSVSPPPSLQPSLVTPSSPQPTFLPKLSSPLQPNSKEETEDEGEELVGHVLFSSDGTVYLLKGEEEEDGASPLSPQNSPKSTVTTHPPLTSFRLTATYQGFCSNQISRHTSAEAASLTPTTPGTLPRIQDQPKEKEAWGQKSKKDTRQKRHEKSIRQQRIDGTWICLPCHLNFHTGGQLGWHASHIHCLDHPYQDQLASGEMSGIIHRSNGKIFISLLEPKRSQNVLDAGQEPENVVLPRVQTTTSLETIQSLPEKSGTSEDLKSNTNPNNTKSQVTFQGNPEGNPKHSMGLVPILPSSCHKPDPTELPHVTEAKDSKALVDEKNEVTNWCLAVTEALSEDCEEEAEDVAEGSQHVSQPSDISEHLLKNQSFYGSMMTSSFIQMGAFHGTDKVGNQTDADRGPLALDDCTPTSGPQPFQSISLQGQLSLLHSRNSCKTLKCPKCNWHYKYQQTLDVHMKEKHPESHSHCSYCHSGQQHPRLARGESYHCGYKPYRCEACNYSTTTKGNLTIHMQSDKHLANLQGYQGTAPTPNTVVPPLSAQPGGPSAGPSDANQPSPTDRQLKQKASWHCKVCNYETNISRNLRIHMTSEKHMQNVLLLHQGLGMGQDNFPFYGGPLAPEQTLDHPLLFNPMHFSSSNNQGCSLLTSDSPSGPQTNSLSSSVMGIPVPPALPDPSSSFPEEDVASGAFRCLICRCYTTDSLEALLSHASRGRSLPEREWREVRGDLHCCRLCSYSTQLKANFQLHLKTDKHAQKYQLAAHMREGGAALATAQASAADLPISGYSQASSFPPLHLRCNLCGYESNSREKIQLHVQGGGHEESLRVYKFLQVIEGGSEVGFRCAPCDSTIGSCLGMMSHLRSGNHHQNVTQWRITHGEAVLERIITVCRTQQEYDKVPKTTATTVASDTAEDNPDIPQVSAQDETSKSECEKPAESTTVFCCPFCAYVSPSEEKVHSHAVSQHALQPTFRCPLCQEQLTGTSSLKAHLGHGHNVVSECVDKLLQVAQKVNITFRTRIIPVQVVEEPEQSPSEVPVSSEATDTSPPGSPAEITTTPIEAIDSVEPEKVPEEASCPLCPLTPENSHELRTHLEKDHPELSHADIQQACEARGRDVEGIEQEDKKGSQESTPTLTPHSTYRKTTNFALDKFMDPSRPHKCVICKESFTQKNILLVHYNSVSHLHKVRKASLDPSLSNRHESGMGSSGHGVQTGQDKPYKCTICHVSYNQSSTLEIHMRSVLHQTRSRSLKQDPSKIISEKPQRDPVCKSETITECRGENVEVGDITKKRQQQHGPCVGVSIMPNTIAPPPVHLSMDLTRPQPLVPSSPLFTSSLLPSFPLIPEALLKLQRQQQQLLLPFYLQELKVNADGGPASLMSFGGAQQPTTFKDGGSQPSLTPRPANEKDEKLPDEREAATGETDGSENPESSINTSADPTGSAARALLENFGYELVTQYNEGRQPATSQAQLQPQPPPPPLDVLPSPSSTENLQCGTCGKHFSNRLILKTHEEHMHQRLLPFEALSQYAASYRRTYDSHNPSGINTEGGPSATPLDFSVTSQHCQSSKEVEEHEAIPEHGLTAEQLRFLYNHLDFPGHLLEEQILWATEKTGLSHAAIRYWYKHKEKSVLEMHEDEEEALRADRMGHRRFSRTKFSDFQTQALTSFFESSAYPRDNEVEQLSTLLGLSGRVVVVWFQNARQKARKQAVEGGTSPSSPVHPIQSGERPAANSKIPPCRKCGISLPCIFQLICHLKICYNDHSEEAEETDTKEEESSKSEQLEASVSDQTDDNEHPICDKEKQDIQQSETVDKQETPAIVTKENVSLPKETENKIQVAEHGDHLVEKNEVCSITSSEKQNKAMPSTSQVQAPLMDLSLLIPTGAVDASSQRKRKHEEESLSPAGSDGGDEPPRDKRLRTTILPEQLDILHRWYLQDSNPTRSTLERISLEVGLKKRVVQVWFQNTRARERKGQYRGVPQGASSTSRQQDESTHEGAKRESSGSSYFYNVTQSQVVPQLLAKSSSSAMQATSISCKPQTSPSLTTTSVTKSLVNTTQALSGILSAAQVIPGLVNPPQTIPNLASSSSAISGLMNTSQTLSGLVNPNQSFPGLVNPAHVLSSLVSSSQQSQGLLLASFPAKTAPPHMLMASPPEAKVHSSLSQHTSSHLSVGKSTETDKLQTNETLESSKVPPSEQQAVTTDNPASENQGGCNLKMSEEKVTYRTVESLMHSPQAGDMSDSSSSDPGPSSPGKGTLNSDGQFGSSGARRYRTQMSSLQLRILKACYSEYRTPSMQECDCLGSEIGLQKRVVQVWFQNARAKEKKAKLQGLSGTASANEGPQPTECTHCKVKYGPTIPCRAHIFSRQHITRLRASIQQQLKEESRYRDTHPSAGAPPVSESKPTSQMLNFQNPAAGTPQIQRITPLLIPGQGIPAPIGGLATFNTGPPPSLMGMTSSVGPALLPRAAPTVPSSTHTTNDTTMESSQPILTAETTGPSALKAASIIGAPFMPFSLAPAATPLFTPQIQGPYFQQLYGLKKRLFPINPVIPHTLLGLLPAAPLKLAPEISSPRKPEPSQTKTKSAGQEPKEEEAESGERDDDLDDEDIPMVDVAMRYECQHCKTSYDEEGEAEAHQRSGCYSGLHPHPPPLRVRVCTYHCLSCQVLLQGPEARNQHLRSQQHHAQSACSDGASSAIPQLRPKSAATSVLMAL